MKRIAGLWLGYLSLVALSACVQKEIHPIAPVAEVEVGSAEVTLPALPAGFLAKRSATDTADPMFILTITGQGMVARKHAWHLDSTGGTFRVANIPAGTRSFVGELEVGGAITHADSARAQVLPGKTVEVYLKLKSASGNAKICVEIEGLPLPPGCEKPRVIPDINGCWTFRMPDLDGGRQATLRFLSNGGKVQGELILPDGQRDSSIGTLNEQGWLGMGLDSPAQDWVFSGHFDTVQNILHGKFYRRNGEPYAVTLITAYRSACVIPIEPVLDSLTCYDAGQVLDSANTHGRLVLLDKGSRLFGYFLWDGYTAMPLTGTAAPINGNRGLYLYGNLPLGLSRRPSGLADTVHYKGQSNAGGWIEYGNIYGAGGSSAHRGIWKGQITACRPLDRELVRTLHRL